MKKSFGKRLLSGVTSALLAVSYSIPSGLTVGDGILSARATDINNLDLSNSIDDVTLLIGDDPANPLRAEDLAATLYNYENAYALGIASQFCVFLKDDFVPTQSDAEGRIAVGGSIDAKTSWGYAIGLGDYVDRTRLDDLLGDGGYAHAIWGANATDKYASPVCNNTKSDYSYNGSGGEDYNTPYQIYVVESPEGVSYVNSSRPDGKRFYDASNNKLIDFNSMYDPADGMLIERSHALAKNSSPFTIESEPGPNGDTVTITYAGGTDEEECVYFNLTPEQHEMCKAAKFIKYANIPTLPGGARQVVDNDGSMKTWDYAYIVVNVGGTSESISGDHNRYTYINDILISKNWEADDNRTNPRPSTDGGFTEGDALVSNNHIGVTSLLYNYYEATELKLARNFQGTILAPKADVTDGNPGAWGHLSGALIAKSFEGNTEFGYRPFTGPISMLGTSTNYMIEVNKFGSDGETFLPGAEIGVYKLDADGNETLVSTTTSTTSTLGIDVPGKGRYVVRELSAPAGYQKSNAEYYFEVTEGEPVEVSYETGKVITKKKPALVYDYDGTVMTPQTDVDADLVDQYGEQPVSGTFGPQADGSWRIGDFQAIEKVRSDYGKTCTFEPYSDKFTSEGATITSVEFVADESAEYGLTEEGKLDPRALKNNNQGGIVTQDGTETNRIVISVTVDEDLEEAPDDIQIKQPWGGDPVKTIPVSGSGDIEIYNESGSENNEYIYLDNQLMFSVPEGVTITKVTYYFNPLTATLNGEGRLSDGYPIENIKTTIKKIIVNTQGDGTVTYTDVDNSANNVTKDTNSSGKVVIFDNTVEPDPKDYTYYLVVSEDPKDYARNKPDEEHETREMTIKEPTVKYYGSKNTFAEADKLAETTYIPVDLSTNIYKISNGTDTDTYKFTNSGTTITGVTKNGEELTGDDLAAAKERFHIKKLLGVDGYWVFDGMDELDPSINITTNDFDNDPFYFINKEAISLRKVDKDDGTILEDARLTLSEVTVRLSDKTGADGASVTYTSDKNGYIVTEDDTTDLEHGFIAAAKGNGATGTVEHIYRISEITPPSNYILTTNSAYFFVYNGYLYQKEIGPDAEIDVPFKADGSFDEAAASSWNALKLAGSTAAKRVVNLGNQEEAKLNLMKVDSSSGQLISGAALQMVKIDDPSLLKDTDSTLADIEGNYTNYGITKNGEGLWQNTKVLKNGTYAVVETSMTNSDYSQESVGVLNLFKVDDEGAYVLKNEAGDNRAVKGFTVTKNTETDVVTVTLPNTKIGDKFVFHKVNEEGKLLSSETASDIDNLKITLTRYNGGTLNDLEVIQTRDVIGANASMIDWTLDDAVIKRTITADRLRKDKEKEAAIRRTVPFILQRNYHITDNLTEVYNIYKIEESGVPSGFEGAKPIFFYYELPYYADNATANQNNPEPTVYILDLNDPANASLTEADYNDLTKYKVASSEEITENGKTYTQFSTSMTDKAKKSDVGFSKRDNRRSFDSEGKKAYLDPDKVIGAKMQLTLVKSYAADATLANITSDPADSFTVSEGGRSITWVTTEETADIVFKDLPDGQYEVTELETPQGYKSAGTYNFISKDGKIYRVGSGNPAYSLDDPQISEEGTVYGDAPIRISDDLLTFNIRKTRPTSKTSDTPVPGAKLKLTAVSIDSGDPLDLSQVIMRDVQLYGNGVSAADKADGDICYGDIGNLVKTNVIPDTNEDPNVIEWESIGNAVTFESIPDGIYTIEETEVPEGGYEKADPMTVKIVGGVIVSSDEELNGQT